MKQKFALRERKKLNYIHLKTGRQENRLYDSFQVRFIGSTKNFCIEGFLQNKRVAVQLVTVMRNLLGFI